MLCRISLWVLMRLCLCLCLGITLSLSSAAHKVGARRTRSFSNAISLSSLEWRFFSSIASFFSHFLLFFLPLLFSSFRSPISISHLRLLILTPHPIPLSPHRRAQHHDPRSTREREFSRYYYPDHIRPIPNRAMCASDRAVKGKGNQNTTFAPLMTIGTDIGMNKSLVALPYYIRIVLWSHRNWFVFIERLDYISSYILL
ncbi:hypothetical protein BDN70DRAFT_888776 [Pholiota conissans]|uniref:Secreted protein n=1 Tax=Pholiota conissans TaxID=109636 RepID=A0A9P6CLK7_9AGAR|nr:hypothetical protein BDN70DRAFT_888776 [Pholiota conissans]